MKRIRVPEGMLKAATDEVENLPDGWRLCRRTLADLAVQAALLWLSEHPQVPTDEQAQQMWNKFAGQPNCHMGRDLPVEWQRRCFVEEGPSERAKSLALRLAGNSFSSQDADFLIEQIMAATTPGYAPPFRGVEAQSPVKEPEIPAEIEDLLDTDDAAWMGTGTVKEALIEAYRRGLTRGSVALRKGEHK